MHDDYNNDIAVHYLDNLNIWRKYEFCQGCISSTSVSNFFHKSHVGQTFEKIVNVPTFAISNTNVGVQLADMIAYILGKKMTGHHSEIREFDILAKELQFRSRKKFLVQGTEYSLFGFKTIKDKNKKEAGDLADPGRIIKSI